MQQNLTLLEFYSDMQEPSFLSSFNQRRKMPECKTFMEKVGKESMVGRMS